LIYLALILLLAPLVGTLLLVYTQNSSKRLSIIISNSSILISFFVSLYLLFLVFRIINLISITTESLFIVGLIIGHIYVETSHYSMHYDTFLTPYVKKLQYHHMSHHL